MSTYGISMIKLDATAGEVVEAKVHRFSKNDDGSIGLDTGRALACHRTVPVVATEDDEGLLG